VITRVISLIIVIILLCPAQEPVIRVNTRLVQVSVLVHDHGGRPVTDLKQDDFTLFDRGKQQRIAFFSMYSEDAVRSTSTARPPNVFSNRGGDDVNIPPSVTIVLMDALNTAADDQQQVRDGVISFLEHMRPEDHVALYGLGHDLRVLHDFTGSQERLLKALAKYRGRVPIELETAQANGPDSTGDDDFDQFIQGMQAQMSDFINNDRALRTYAALEAIADHVSALPGRKNLVWISGGFPFTIGIDSSSPAPTSQPLDPLGATLRERHMFVEEGLRAARAMSNANVAIYPVDARGTRIDRTETAASDARSSKRGIGAVIHTATPIDQNFDTMSQLADRTGGRTFFNTNDFAGAIARAVDDARVTYTLGFYPDGEPDDKFHELRVKVNRSGSDVRYRKGYLDSREAAPAPDTWKAEVQRAMASPISSAEVGLEVTVEPDALKARTYKLRVRLNGPDLPLVQKQDAWTGNVDLQVTQFRPDGTVANAARSPLNITLPADRLRPVLERGLRLTLTMDAVKDVALAQVMVLDEAHGRIGSVRFPLK